MNKNKVRLHRIILIFFFSKMKSLKFSLLVLIILSATIPFSGCNKNEDLSVCHEVINPVAQINTPINFVNCSEGAESFKWNFGDGNSSTQFDPSHSYSSKGMYYTQLEGFNQDGGMATSPSEWVIIYDSIMPKQMVINEAHVRYFQSNNSDHSWDSDDSGPDILIAFESYSVRENKTLFKSKNRHDDCVSGEVYSFGIESGLPYTVNNLNESMVVSLYDFDGNENNSQRPEFGMGGVGIIPYENGLNPGKTIVISGTNIEIELNVTWIY